MQNPNLFIPSQYSGPSIAPAHRAPNLVLAKRPAANAPLPAHKVARHRPVAGNPRLHNPALVAVAGPIAPAAGGQPARQQYICVSDFMTKLDAARYPSGCTTVGCVRRHIPLPPVGQFAPADKADILRSIGRMRGNQTAPMLALVQPSP